MSFLTYSFRIQRPVLDADGALTLPAVPGSPFTGRMHYVTGGSGQRFENVPEVAKAQRAEVLFLDNSSAPVSRVLRHPASESGFALVRIGDLVTLPPALAAGAADGALRKIIQVRPYEISLQCGLQRQPFTPLPSWTPQAELRRTEAATLKVKDLAFDAAGPVLAYLEPAPDMVKAAVFGKLDTRACVAYTLAPLALGTVLQDARGDYWVAELPSDIWPLPGDCKTLMRHLIAPPPGIAFLDGPAIPPPPAGAGPAPVSLPSAVLSLQAQLNAQAAQIGEMMTALKNPAAVNQTDAQTITGAATTAGAPLPVPAVGKSNETYVRTLTANLTDFAYSANQAGRTLTQQFKNAVGSGAFVWTITAQTGETFDTPGLGLVSSVPLQAGEARTFVNTGTATWSEV